LKADTKQGLKLQELFNSIEVGKSMPLPSIMPGVDTVETQAFMRTKSEGYWLLALYWNGIECGEVTAQVHGGEIIFEVL
jgi:hypothetical protein